MTLEEMRAQIEAERAKNRTLTDQEKRDQNIVTGAPLEGATREGEVNKNASPLMTDNARNAQLADEAARTGKDALSATTGGKLSQGDERLAKTIVGDNVVEDKNAEAVKADLSSALASPGRLPAQESLNPSRTVQREDGTITTADRPDLTAHYVHGSRMMLRQEDVDKLNALTAELNKLQDGRGISDIPISDLYWEKKRELDGFVATLRR